MRRPVLLLLALAVAAPAAAAATADPAQTWALPQIKLVLARGLMGAQDPAAFRPADPLTRDTLELLPDQPATRAEAAYSVAQILGFRGWEGDGLRNAAANFTLPAYNGLQQRVLDTAVKFIGYPYIWGGESESTKSPFGSQVQG